jgi:hypothetical protein
VARWCKAVRRILSDHADWKADQGDMGALI